jgi:hypothetical protein
MLSYTKSVTGVFWIITISVFVLGEVLDLLSGARQAVHPVELTVGGSFGSLS